MDLDPNMDFVVPEPELNTMILHLLQCTELLQIAEFQ